MPGLVLLAIFGIASFVLAFHARSPEPLAQVSVPTPQAAAVALLPQRIPVALQGTLVLDEALAKEAEPFLLFTEQKEGRTVVKTKRLVFPTGESYRFLGGERVEITGIAEADLIYVETLRFL